MRIGQLEEELGISRETVRFYIAEGLISPQQLNNRYREYSGEDILRLKYILILRQLGFGIPEVKKVLTDKEQYESDLQNALDYLEWKSRELQVLMEICEALIEDGFFDFDPDPYFRMLPEPYSRKADKDAE